ncbi:23 kDa jasmonate-induced protein [Bienertia sinuspersici]
MASSVFGTPVTDAMLRKMPEYQGKNSISQQDRAKVALDKVNAEGKSLDARNLLEKLQTRFGGTDLVSTMCLIYNATGASMTFVIAQDWKGRLCESAYPVIIANGQWGVFLHGQYYGGSSEKCSRAGIVYSALNNEGTEKHWFMEIREPGHYDPNNKGVWTALDGHLRDGKLVHQANENGGYVSGSIGNTGYPIFEAIMTLPEAI